MYTDRQIERMLVKLRDFERTLETQLFLRVDEVALRAFPTDGRWHDVPPEENFALVPDGQVFEGEGTYCWFRGRYTVPERLAGRALYIWPRMQSYEALLFVDGEPYGNFAAKILAGSHGNHYCDLLLADAAAGRTVEIAIEAYAGHYVIGTQPYDDKPRDAFAITYHPADLCVRNERAWDFYFDLKVVNDLAASLPQTDFVRAKLVRALKKVHETVFYDPTSVEEETYWARIQMAAPYLKEALSDRNGPSAPRAGLIGHSHMDTAWLWHRGETEKKCARTYANQMSLMDQYPEYTFIQSSAYHSAIIKRLYPRLFARIRERVREGRYEPNGGVFIECDGNVPSGEYMVRQFLWGQRFTRENFGYTADAFWLPDTFGYSASLPQIMKGSKVRYFLTTKMDWNDTNVFPYDTFVWQGIDGSRVLTHRNRTHVWPSPKNLLDIVCSKEAGIQERAVSDSRLISYGFGDGGGGPEFEMIEMARREGDVEGLPTTGHTTVSRFMRDLEARITDPTVYVGELYLELHRGTLTNQHEIKRNNRKAEFALRDLEILTVADAVRRGAAASPEGIRELTEGLLINQFHDILPGTCAPRAHDEARAEVSGIIAKAQAASAALLGGEGGASVTVVNTLSFDREDVLYLDVPAGWRVAGGYPQQRVTDLYGGERLAVAGVRLPALGSVTLCLEEGETEEAPCPFAVDGNTVETGRLRLVLDPMGGIASYWDKLAGRELRGEGGLPLNTFLIAEDVPAAWDNWDVDADLEAKLRPTAALLERRVVSLGQVECRIRSTYRLTEKSTLCQDMVIYADSPDVAFFTRMNWQDDHRFLKAAFDTSLAVSQARQEIQFGCIQRSTARSSAEEKARFEVCNHKYTDLSETRYGAALLNDCKYGISLEGGSMRLSLHKGGRRPDWRGDKGVHDCAYAFHPHMGGFGAEAVVQPAYAFNVPPLAARGARPVEPLLTLAQDNVLVEAIKPMEDGGRAFLIRLYECEGATVHAQMRLGLDPIKVEETNLLEDVERELPRERTVRLTFRPFEIKSIKVTY